ncbi:MAG: hypothetical protein PVS3B3_13800 [Ktedonobacteraceae bacterium]
MSNKGFLDKAFCSACHKPGLVCAGTARRKSECYNDKLGYHWCPEHAVRGKLLDWAQKREFASVSVTLPNGSPRRFGHPGAKASCNEEMWVLAVIQGDDETIRAAEEHMKVAKFMSDEQGA